MAERKPVIVIEHLEESMGLWVFLEYRHSSMIYGREYLWFTNVPSKYHRILCRYGKVFSKSIVDLVKDGVVGGNEVLVLDPQAEKSLTYDDLLRYKYIVIGGILGDHPPRGRTKELLAKRLGKVETRNIGNRQYSIDGSVYYVNYLWTNKDLGNYKYIDGVEIKTPTGIIYLPFRYPVVEGKPLLAPGLREYLVKGSVPRSILKELEPL